MNYSDEYINYWGELYTDNNLRLVQCFDDFLKNPVPFLTAKIAMAKSAKAIQDELVTVKGRVVELHGDRLIQPLHKRQKVRAWKTNTNRSTHS